MESLLDMSPSLATAAAADISILQHCLAGVLLVLPFPSPHSRIGQKSHTNQNRRLANGFEDQMWVTSAQNDSEEDKSLKFQVDGACIIVMLVLFRFEYN
ncbi:hypothetical protein V2J09_008916 [Rumex salicifolius]